MRRTKGKDLLKCFHCGGKLDVNQHDAWFHLMERQEILYCNACVEKHNAAVARTGMPQPMPLSHAPNGLVEFMGKRYGAQRIPFEKG